MRRILWSKLWFLFWISHQWRKQYHVIQWNLYKATNKFCGLSRQVVFRHRENKHDFVETMPSKWWNLCVFSRTFPVSLYRFHCIGPHYNGTRLYMVFSKIIHLWHINSLQLDWRFFPITCQWLKAKETYDNSSALAMELSLCYIMPLMYT